MTEEQKQKYLENQGNICPYCESTEIQGKIGIEMQDGKIYQPIHCTECKKEWEDVYTLSDAVVPDPNQDF